MPVEQPGLLASALGALDEAVYRGVGAVADEVGLSRPMLELITGMAILEPDPALVDGKVVPLLR